MRAIASGDKTVRQDTGTVCKERKYMIRKIQIMKASNPRDRIKLAVLSKLISRCKVVVIRKCIMERTEPTLKNGGSLKALQRRLGIGKNQTYALRDMEGMSLPIWIT